MLTGRTGWFSQQLENQELKISHLPKRRPLLLPCLSYLPCWKWEGKEDVPASHGSKGGTPVSVKTSNLFVVAWEVPWTSFYCFSLVVSYLVNCLCGSVKKKGRIKGGRRGSQQLWLCSWMCHGPRAQNLILQLRSDQPCQIILNTRWNREGNCGQLSKLWGMVANQPCPYWRVCFIFYSLRVLALVFAQTIGGGWFQCSVCYQCCEAHLTILPVAFITHALGCSQIRIMGFSCTLHSCFFLESNGILGITQDLP